MRALHATQTPSRSRGRAAERFASKPEGESVSIAMVTDRVALASYVYRPSSNSDRTTSCGFAHVRSASRALGRLRCARARPTSRQRQLSSSPRDQFDFARSCNGRRSGVFCLRYARTYSYPATFVPRSRVSRDSALSNDTVVVDREFRRSENTTPKRRLHNRGVCFARERRAARRPKANTCACRRLSSRLDESRFLLRRCLRHVLSRVLHFRRMRTYEDRITDRDDSLV